MKPMKWLIIVVGVLLPAFVIAQYSARIVVSEVATKKLDDLYIAGSFNNWQPKEEKYKLKPFGKDRKGIVLKDLAPGIYEFKITRGSWLTVESKDNGDELSNRSFAITDADVSIDITIAGFKDDFPKKPIPNTASAQVHLIDSVFQIPQLQRTRAIWVYLPKSYNVTKGKNYPVLYMHDAQNLFNLQTAPNGEWGVDECLDSLQRLTGKECIVVGINHGNDKRLTEYNPYDHAQFGKGEGKQYLNFIVSTLKPYIDKTYRTRKDAANTAIAGSSMGGVISVAAMVQHPDVFGAAGIFSPAFWVAPSLYTDVANAHWKTQQPRFYFYAGGREGTNPEVMVKDMEAMVTLLEKKAQYDIRRVVNPLGQHNEKAWQQAFDDFYRWLSSRW
ncbi:MAG: alpha/beta hydrolase-fold protein [Chitinophagaceae bacterium]